jgi:hypothetical protein
VAVELELNDISPPPDTVEEEKESRDSLKSNASGRAESRYINSKREINEVKHPAKVRKALESSVIVSQSTIYTTLIVRF